MNSISKSMLVVFLAAIPGFCADWNPRAVADYLDARQKDWSTWPRAKAEGGYCFSCHTGMTYMFVRPQLRGVLGETQPTQWENGLLKGLRARLDRQEPKDSSSHAVQEIGVESVFAALFFASDDMNADANKAFDRLWTLQIREGDGQGSWNWFALDRDPWEMPESQFFGSTLAAMAVARTPASYRNKADVKEHVAALCEYLRREQAAQPLHHRLMLLWAASTLPDLLPDADRKTIVAAAWKAQQADGGWTLESLGPWKKREKAPVQTGSNSYATALAAFVQERAGAGPKDARLTHALDWLLTHQDAEGGTWSAESMNKVYDPGTMPVAFMRDAATSFAAMALIDSRK